MRNTGNISWIKAARRDFEDFPEDVQTDMFDALTVAAEGGKSEKAKPFKGVDGGVFEIALRYRGVCSRSPCDIAVTPFVRSTPSKSTRIFG